MKNQALLLVLLLSGCDALFPGPRPQDMAQQKDGAAADLGDLGPRSGRLDGQICALDALRDYRGCSPGYPHGPIGVTVVETGTQTTTGTDGRFVLDLAQAPPQVRLLAQDPRQGLVPALVQVPLGGSGLALPMVTSDRQAQLRLQGIPLDPGRGAILGYVVDLAGTPIAGVQAQASAADHGWLGPYYAAGGEQLESGPTARTDAGGLVALFELPAGQVTLTLSGARQGISTYTIPVQAGVTTFTLLR